MNECLIVLVEQFIFCFNFKLEQTVNVKDVLSKLSSLMKNNFVGLSPQYPKNSSYYVHDYRQPEY